MGFFSGVKKLIKKALKLTGLPSIWKGAKSIWNGLTGKTAADNMAASQEEQLKQQQEQSKLNAANEVGNVTQFEDDTGAGFGENNLRRKRRAAGAFSSGIGLQI